MGTVNTALITPAMKKLELLGAGVTPTTDEAADALIILNQLLESLRNDKLMCYAIQDETVTLSSGQTTRTVGPTGSLVTTRPVEIQTAYIIVSGQSYPVEIINEDQYAAIPDKTSTSNWPNKIWYQPSMPDGTIYIHPVTSGSSALHILTRTPVLAYAATTDAVSLPPGWERMLSFNLAVELASDWGKPVPPQVMMIAASSMRSVKRMNSRPLKLYSELPYLVGQTPRGHIISDRA